MLLNFRPISFEDWEPVKHIYESGISTGIATFQTSAPTWEEWDLSHHSFCRIHAKKEGKIVAWAALSPVSKRAVYKGVAEVSLYVHPDFRGQHIGEQLFIELISQSKLQGIWTLQSSIFPQNMGSLKLHQKVGFRIVGNREKIGQRNGVWHDNLLLEKRF
jgi:L-amino acid N-acyltransferase YncA